MYAVRDPSLRKPGPFWSNYKLHRTPENDISSLDKKSLKANFKLMVKKSLHQS